MKDRVLSMLIVVGAVLGLLGVFWRDDLAGGIPGGLLIVMVAWYLLFYDVIQAYRKAVRQGRTVTEPHKVRQAARILKVALGIVLAAPFLVFLFPLFAMKVLPSAARYYPEILVVVAVIMIIALFAAVPALIVIGGDFLSFLRRQDSLHPRD